MADNKKNKGKLSKEEKDALKLKQWRQAKTAHKPKNRSSKHLRLIPQRDICRSVSRELLKQWASNGNFDAQQELNRRDARRERREANRLARGA